MTRATIQSLGSGVGGAIVLCLFSATFLTVEKAVFIMPLFLGFTAAMTGFQLVQLLGGTPRGRILFPLVLGAGHGVLVFSMINILGPPIAGIPLGLTAGDLFIYILTSGITSVLGARLAAGYFKFV